MYFICVFRAFDSPAAYDDDDAVFDFLIIQQVNNSLTLTAG